MINLVGRFIELIEASTCPSNVWLNSGSFRVAIGAGSIVSTKLISALFVYLVLGFCPNFPVSCLVYFPPIYTPCVVILYAESLPNSLLIMFMKSTNENVCFSLWKSHFHPIAVHLWPHMSSYINCVRPDSARPEARLLVLWWSAAKRRISKSILDSIGLIIAVL